MERSEADEARLAGLRAKAAAARAARVRPGLDDKVLADWNGLMIAALANAGLMLRRAVVAGHRGARFEFVARTMTRGDRLGHSWREASSSFRASPPITPR